MRDSGLCFFVEILKLIYLRVSISDFLLQPIIVHVECKKSGLRVLRILVDIRLICVGISCLKGERRIRMTEGEIWREWVAVRKTLEYGTTMGVVGLWSVVPQLSFLEDVHARRGVHHRYKFK